MNKWFLILAIAIALTAGASPCRAGGYCAIAYSCQSERYGYSDGYTSRGGAERRALEGCGTYDARIVGWAHNEYVALARGEGNSWGCGVARTRGEAERIALNNCPSRGAYIIKWVCSFD
jgi:hypothetical protein